MMLTLLQLSVDGDPQARPHGQLGVAVAAEHTRCPPRVSMISGLKNKAILYIHGTDTALQAHFHENK